MEKMDKQEKHKSSDLKHKIKKVFKRSPSSESIATFRAPEELPSTRPSPRYPKSPRLNYDTEIDLSDQPPRDELESRFELLLETLADQEETKNKMRALSPRHKWTLLVQRKQDSVHQRHPCEYYIDILSTRKATQSFSRNDTHELLSTLEHLVVSLKGEPVLWVSKFIKMGGVMYLVDILRSSLKKSKSQERDIADIGKQMITQIVLALRSTMQDEEGILAMVETQAIELLVMCLNFVSDRMKINVLQLIAASSIINMDVHRSVIPLVSKDAQRFVSMSSQNKPLDLVVATFTCINALVTAQDHELLGKLKLKENLLKKGLAASILEWRSKPTLPTQLETQLNIFEDALDVDLSMYTARQENPEDIFMKLLKQVKGGLVHPLFIGVLQNLLVLPRYGKLGVMCWTLAEKFVQCLSALDSDITDAKDAWESLTKSMKPQLENIDFTHVETPNVSLKISTGPTLSDAPPLSAAPPPPPPPTKGIPPPPPPGGGRGPPPPPGAGPSNLPTKPVIIPNKKMRRFYWTKIPQKDIRSTLWEDVDAIKVDMPVQQLEDLFSEKEAVKTLKPMEKDGLDSTSEDMTDISDKKKSSTIILLDPKRWQNVAIMLSRFKSVPYSSVHDAVLQLDESVLDLDTIIALSQFTPQPEEIELLKQYSDTPPPNLGNPERFFLAMMNIPKLDIRLQCWLHKQMWNTNFSELDKNISLVLSTSILLKKSTHLKTLLKIILELGNYLNGNTTYGQAWGFKLESLQKMLDLRSQLDSKTTLLHFMAEYLGNQCPNLRTNLTNELSSMSDAKNQSILTLTADLAELRKGLTNTTEYCKLLKDSPSPLPKMENFLTIMPIFMEQVKKDFDSLEQKSQDMQMQYKEVVGYFGEDPTKLLDCNDFFGTIHRFLMSFEKANKDLIRWKEQQEKAINKPEQQHQSPTTSELPIPKVSLPVNRSDSAAKMGMLDQVLADLSSGKAYTANATKSRQKRHRKKRKSQPKHKGNGKSLSSSDIKSTKAYKDHQSEIMDKKVLLSVKEETNYELNKNLN